MRSVLLPLIAAALAAPAHPAAQAFHHVPAQYPTIQAALDAAQPGDVVAVAKGVYAEHLSLREDVALIGAGWRKTIVDAGGSGSPATAQGVHNFQVEGVTLRGAGPGHAGLEIEGSFSMTFGVTSVVRRCRIVDNDLGVRVSDVHSGILTLDLNVIDRNRSHGVDPHLGTLLLRRNTIANNGGDGVRLTDGAGLNYLTSNAIVGNAGHGVIRTPSTPLLAVYNNLYGNAQGTYTQIVGTLPVAFAPQPGTGETAHDPGFFAPENGDFQPTATSPLIDAGDPSLALDADGSPPDVGALAYDPLYAPASATYGAGCGPTSAWYHAPILGQAYYEVRVHATPATPCVLLAGGSTTAWMGLPLPFGLAPLGAPGCALLAAPTLTFAHATGPGGDAARKITIPGSPTLAGATLAFQWMVAAPGANPLGFTFSDGLKATIQP